MVNKLFLVSVVVFGVIVVILLMTVTMPTIKTFTDIAVNDNTTGNYWGYKAAAGSAPLWLYGVPLLVGGLAVFMILRAKERG